jgi:hypothetical protein
MIFDGKMACKIRNGDACDNYILKKRTVQKSYIYFVFVV